MINQNMHGMTQNFLGMENMQQMGGGLANYQMQQNQQLEGLGSNMQQPNLDPLNFTMSQVTRMQQHNNLFHDLLK